VFDDGADYADAEAQAQNSITWEWMHPTAEVLTALLDAGLRLDFYHEHDVVPWQLFGSLVEQQPGLWGWPAERWLPLTFSLGATNAAGG
jgi:hypothetical protein